MRKFIKAFSIYAVCLLLIFGCVLSPCVSSYAAENIPVTLLYELSSPYGMYESLQPVISFIYDGTDYVYVSSNLQFDLNTYRGSITSLEPGDYVITGRFDAIYTADEETFVVVDGIRLVYLEIIGSNLILADYGSFEFGETIHVPSLPEPSEPTFTSRGFFFLIQSQDPNVTISFSRGANIYQSAWDMFNFYIYGDMEMTPEMNLTLTLLATLISVAVVVLPFVIIWLIIRFVSSLLR